MSYFDDDLADSGTYDEDSSEGGIYDFTAPRKRSEGPQAEFTVTEFVRTVGDLLTAEFSDVTIIGELSSLKVNQGRWVFFDLKDDDTSLGCFSTVYKVHAENFEDGMKVIVKGHPSITKWGKFSFTVDRIMPVGEGSIKRAFELLKKKLTAEGLFDPARKRPIPEKLQKIGVISSTQAAGYADFIKIVSERWGGLEIKVAHTGVQGMNAAPQIIRALKYMNEKSEVQIIAIIRGGGSADDLSVFNDEALVRAIAASKIPVITGIGHEVDTCLADLAADVVASTPSNAAQMLTRDRRAYISAIKDRVRDVRVKVTDQITLNKNQERSDIQEIRRHLFNHIDEAESQSVDLSRIRFFILNKIDAAAQCVAQVPRVGRLVGDKIDAELANTKNQERVLASLNPEDVLKKGYAIIRGDVDVGKSIEVETVERFITAEVKEVKEK